MPEGKIVSDSQGKREITAGGKASGEEIASTGFDNLPKEIHDGAQGKHIEGHNNYKLNKVRSILDVDPREILLGIHSGKYKIIRNAGGKPIVDFGKPIERFGEEKGPVASFGIIHNGKLGSGLIL